MSDQGGSKLKGRLRRLHSSRVRSTEASEERAGEGRVFFADPEPEPDLVSSPSPAPPAAAPADLAALRVDEYTYDADYRHGDHALARCLEWSDPSAVVGLRGRALEEVLFLDIETAGLRQRDPIICLGVGWWRGEVFHVKQWTLHELDAEVDLLAALARVTPDFEAACTYNGKSFDVPRISHRLAHFGLSDDVARLGHVDLIHTARRQLPRRAHRLDLGSLERDVLGFRRAHDLPGREVPERWRAFCESRKPDLLDDVVSHNHLDVLSLTALLGRFAQGSQLPLPIGRRGRARREAQKREAPRASPSATAPVSSPGVQEDALARPPLSALQRRLARTYELRARSSVGSSAPAPGRSTSSSAGGEDLRVGERVALLRRRVQRMLDAGEAIEACAPMITELVALAPRHPFGLELLARYYRAIGARQCAEHVEARLGQDLY